MRGLNLTATLKADGKSYAVLCLDFASDEVRLFNDENQTDFYVNLGAVELSGFLRGINRADYSKKAIKRAVKRHL